MGVPAPNCYMHVCYTGGRLKVATKLLRLKIPGNVNQKVAVELAYMRECTHRLGQAQSFVLDARCFRHRGPSSLHVSLPLTIRFPPTLGLRGRLLSSYMKI